MSEYAALMGTLIFIGLIVLFFIFFVFREVNCWYFKINQRISIAEETNKKLEELNGNLRYLIIAINVERRSVNKNGDVIWYNDNEEIHRSNDKPAIIMRDGTKIWCKNGKRHRDGNKPAEIRSNGYQEYYRDGVKYVP